MRAVLAAATDPRWPAMLESTAHDFYHLPAYVSLAASQEQGEARALIVEGDGATMLLPLVIRAIPAGGMDAASPYGYPCPLSTTTEPGFLQEAWSTGIDRLRAEGLVSLFVRFHPLLGSAPPDGIGTVIQHGETVAVDLATPADELWRQIRKSHRRDIEKAAVAGFTARVDPSWDSFESFKQLYRATMSRSGADAFYFFDDAYFDGLRAALGPRLLLAVTEVDGLVAAAGLYSETGGIVQAHLSGVDPAFAHWAPTKVLDRELITWAKERGDRWLHLGGGRGGEHDSLLMYKGGFSPLRFPYHSLRVAVNEKVYTRLVEDCDPTLDPTRLDGFFPAYRRDSTGMA